MDKLEGRELHVVITDDGNIRVKNTLNMIETLGVVEYLRATTATEMVHQERRMRSGKPAVEVPTGSADKRPLLAELCKECSEMYTSLRPLNSCKDHEGFAKL